MTRGGLIGHDDGGLIGHDVGGLIGQAGGETDWTLQGGELQQRATWNTKRPQTGGELQQQATWNTKRPQTGSRRRGLEREGGGRLKAFKERPPRNKN